MEDDEAFVKLIVVGDQNVGKTSMLNQFCYNKFENNQAPTIACDFTMKVTQFNGQVVRLQLWDIAGQERYQSVSKLYVRGAHGCIVVGDIKDESSLQECLTWKNIVTEHCNQTDGNNIPLILVQNKVDETKTMGRLEDFQKMDYLEQFGKENGFNRCFQTSAKDGTNIKELFNTMLEIIVESGVLQKEKVGNFGESERGKSQVNNNVKLSQAQVNQKPQKKGCC